jgi:RNA polymerase sigma-70 factor, ECF subfamily
VSAAVLAGRRRSDCPQVLRPDEAAAHLTRLYRLAWSLCGSPHVAEDLVQETYLRVLARPRRLRNSDSFAYLARTLRNVTMDHRRAEQTRERPRHATDEVVDDPPDHRGTGDPVLAALAGEVYGAVSGLPEHHREVVAAVDMAGMTYGQAAQSLGIPIGSVMSRLHRARDRLADVLGDDWH